MNEENKKIEENEETENEIKNVSEEIKEEKSEKPEEELIKDIIHKEREQNSENAPDKIVVEHIYNEKSFKSKLISVLLVVVMGVSCFLAGALSERIGSGNVNYRKLEKIQYLIDKNYYFKDQIDHDKAFDNALSVYTASFGDQFTYYLDEDYLEEFNQSITGNYVGIGVTVTTDEDGYVVLTQCFKGGSAMEVGMLPGDKIVSVDGKDVVGLSVDDVVAKIKGEEGGKVKVSVLRDEKNVDFELTRKAVTIETVTSKIIGDSIGYINISSFDVSTDEEFVAAYEKISKKNKLTGLIIDLRNNGGGLLDSVVNVADYLMPESTIVSIKYRNAKDSVYKSDEKCVDVPIVVLTNEYTASASELLAGGLRVNNKAKLVGTKTYGKGVVGTQFDVDSKTAVVITVGEYFLPDGTNIHKKGIQPDVEVKLNENIKNIYLADEKEDNQLQQAIEELKK